MLLITLFCEAWMEKQEILENLNTLKERLLLDVGTSFENEGSYYGLERLDVWTTLTTSFFKEHMPSEVKKLGILKMSCGILLRRSFETDFEYYWRAYGEKYDAYLKSLIRVVTDDEYDFTPKHKEVKQVETQSTPKAKSNKVFIVHGHDGEVKYRTANFLRQHGLDPIILHLKANRNRTIIEKLEKYTEDVGYGIVLYTPDDLGQVKPKASNGELDNRARQNVIFEHGYLMGLIGRENVLAIVKGDIELPSDISGVVYIDDTNWEMDLLRELHDAGYPIDAANL